MLNMGSDRYLEFLAEEVRVPVDDGLALEDGEDGCGAEECSKGNQRGSRRVALMEDDEDQSEDCSGHYSPEEDEKRLPRAQPCGDHGEEFGVAEAHAFLAAHKPIRSAYEDDDSGCAECVGNGVKAAAPSSAQSGIDDTECDSGKSEGIGKQQGFGVGDG